MLSRENLVNLLAHRDFYENISYYKLKDDDLLNPVKELLGPDWKLLRGSAWFVCYPPQQEPRDLPIQGWKIHVSTDILNAKEIIRAVVPILKRNETSFKFALDNNILTMMNSKSWARQGAGKFITVYPTADKFKSLIEELYQATKEFEGLYILSDRRYKNSRTVFYRYGGMRQHDIFNITGERTPVLLAPDGRKIPDRRTPYYAFPEWAEEPFPSEQGQKSQGAKDGGVLLKDGRYCVERVLFFSNSGGVYVARDRENEDRQVVVKEARPCVTVTQDAVVLLKKEHKILTKLEHLNIAPKPIDFFQDWEHYFLVEELIEGIPLATYSARHNVTLLTRPTIKDSQDFYSDFKKIFIQLAQIIDLLHQNNIVFGDLSPNNIIVRSDDLKLTIIDFEAAFEVDVDKPIYLYTPGFASADQAAGTPPTYENDYYSLGAIMHFFLVPINSMMQLKPAAKHEFLESVIGDIGFPRSVQQVIRSLIDDDPAKRPGPCEVVRALSGDERAEAPALQFCESRREDYASVIKGISDFTLHFADCGRRDRLFPADAKVFWTNPLSISYGACGVAYALNKMTGGVPDEVVNWILSQEINNDLYPPGLYLGLSGIAWVLLEIGLREKATEVLELSFSHPLLRECADMYYGISGWGMANLKFFAETQDVRYLEMASRAGLHLLNTRAEDENGYSWPYENNTFFGLAHGASGVALFLLYLYLATDDESFLDAGRKALDFDINNGDVNLDGGLSWKYRVSNSSVILPYWRYGSAGVGTCLLRYYKLLGEEKYKDALDRVYLDTDRKYAVFPGRTMGLAGIGDFLLDMYDFLGDACYLRSAERLASGLLLFQIKREQGIAFPGNRLLRISCDYGTGSAGIGLFLHRLMTGGGSDFMLDELFERNLAEKLCHV